MNTLAETLKQEAQQAHALGVVEARRTQAVLDIDYACRDYFETHDAKAFTASVRKHLAVLEGK